MRHLPAPRRTRWFATPLTLLLAGSAAHAQSTEGLGMPARPAEPAPEVQATKLTKLPKQTKFVEAEYPKEAVAKGIETDVILMLDINAEGKVDSVALAEPVNPPGLGFDEAAMVAAQQFEFEPAEMNGQKIAVQITYKYKFKLTAKAATAPTPAPEAPADASATTPAEPAAAAPSKPAPAPVVNFAGVLRERGTRLPLAGLLVTVFRDDGDKPVGYEAASDETGAFTFYDLTPGEWKVLIEPPGFYPYRTTETIKVGERIDVV
ncbi:MAG TPA: TonB family protein, partial [Polyangia bacterium]|nr:TonB family protein [Polyangia bacterium]